MNRSFVQYKRDGPSLEFSYQNIDAAELRALIVGLSLIIKKSEPNSIDVRVRLDKRGADIAQAILRGYEKGPVLRVPAGDAGHLLG